MLFGSFLVVFVVEDLMGRGASHAVVVAAPTVGIRDEPGVRLAPGLDDGGEVRAVKGESPELLEDRLVGPLAGCVVVRRAGEALVKVTP
jgi:hypothetical protein